MVYTVFRVRQGPKYHVYEMVAMETKRWLPWQPKSNNNAQLNSDVSLLAHVKYEPNLLHFDREKKIMIWIEENDIDLILTK